MPLIGHPQVMRLATRYGLPRPLLMKFTLKLLANLTDPRGGDALDRVINGLLRSRRPHERCSPRATGLSPALQRHSVGPPA